MTLNESNVKDRRLERMKQRSSAPSDRGKQLSVSVSISVSVSLSV